MIVQEINSLNLFQTEKMKPNQWVIKSIFAKKEYINTTDIYMNKVALIIIYNHQFNKNIDVLERIYKDRFSNIYHLMPFYNGVKQNVIPVYECSYYFQGYISQGFKSFYKKDYTHYFFIADDLILNPEINENNYSEHLKLGINSCFIPGFISLHDLVEWWPRVGEAYRWSIDFSGIEAKNQLPDYEKALQKFQQFGLKISPLRFNQIWKTPSSIKEFLKLILDDKIYFFRYLMDKFSNKRYKLSYPIIGSYSDICIISSDTIKQFCHYCGVFAATRLFVEVGLPTSLVLSANDIRTEKDLKYKGKALWTKKDYQELDIYDNSLKHLFSEFPENYLYLHPIKLSKWHIEL